MPRRSSWMECFSHLHACMIQLEYQLALANTVHYPRSGYHCRFKNPLHCRILNRRWHTGSDVGLTSLPVLKTDTDLHETVSVPGSTRQCLVEQHCWFVEPIDSNGYFNNVGSWLKSVVLSKPTLSACVSSRQC